MGQRAAFAVAGALTLDVATGTVIPFLGALFAAQFLLSGLRPLAPAKAIGLTLLILVMGQVFVALTTVFADRPLQLLIVLGFSYFVFFFAQASGRGGPAILFCLVVSVMVPLLQLVHDKLDSTMLAILARGVVGGVLWSWLAHALLPDPGPPDTAPPVLPPPIQGAVLRAVGSTLILLAAVTLCLTNSRFSTAMVVPITVASLLLQLDLAASNRAAIGLVLVNLLGGVLASLAYAVMEMRPSLLLLFLLTLFVCLLLAGRAAGSPALEKVHAGALTTFLILFGLGVSPLPTSTPESFSSRFGFIAFAVVYTLLATALLWRRDWQAPDAKAAAQS